MFMLRFTFQNHASFRDEADLTMVKPTLRTASPQDGTWVDYTTRVAAIYGANASGKSTVLDALRYMQTCVRDSATEWSKRKTVPKLSFALDKVSKKRASTFILDFVLDDVRYEYGFSALRSRFEEEWLYTFPTGRKRIIFERGEAGSIEAGRELGGGGPSLKRAVDERQLVLSIGALLKHPVLMPIHDAIVDKIDIARFGESDRESRLRSVVQDIADGSLGLDDLRTMLRVADIGIVGAEVKDAEADPKAVKFLRAFLAAQRQVEGDAAEVFRASVKGEGGEIDTNGEDFIDDDIVEKIISQVARSLMFAHRGSDEETYSLPSSRQSTGTLTWLSLAAPAIKTVREGGVLAVDEIDASLHPQLAQVMIQMFRDASINKTGAQLIFTTHDTYFMSSATDSRLSPDEVWFVEKNESGASDLYRLSDFPTRADQNLSRRYLQGRYGAVPSVAPSFLAGLVGKRESLDVDHELV